MAEVALGQLAVEKASSADVKKFGQRMVDDYSKANYELKQLPVISVSAQRAAHRIVDACLRGEAEVTLSFPAKVAVCTDCFQQPPLISSV